MYSLYEMSRILATGQFEWTQKHHQIWSDLQIEILTKKYLGNRESSKLSPHIIFGGPGCHDFINLKVSDAIKFYIYQSSDKRYWIKYHQTVSTCLDFIISNRRH